MNAQISQCLLNLFVAVFILLIAGTASANPIGSTSGTFEVSPLGAATYTVPLAVPPGAVGMQPKMALTYDSNSKNGLLGIGWTLSGLSQITRCPNTIVQDGLVHGVDFGPTDKLCMDGQRLVAISGDYLGDNAEYRTESESFAKIVPMGAAYGAPLSFHAQAKNGLVYVYGTTADSRVEAQGKNQVLLWRLNRLQDSYANYMDFSYFEDNNTGETYLLRIDYTGNSIPTVNKAPHNSARFVYEDRPDTAVGYVSGSKVSITKRLKAVQMFNEDTLVWEYQLNYDVNSIASRSRLVEIKECGPSQNCLRPITISYTQGDTGFEAAQVVLSSSSQDLTSEGKYEAFADFNGDGLTDRIWRPVGLGSYFVALSTGSGFSTPQEWLPANSGGGGAPSYSENGRYESYADFNGDGLADRIWRPVGLGGYFVALSTGSSFLPPQQWQVANTGGGGAPSYSDNGQYESYADFNGDGLADRIWRPVGLGGYFVALSTGSGFLAPQQWQVANTGGGGAPSFSENGQYESYADFNGDGLTDRIWKPVGLGGYFVALSTGSSFLAPQQWQVANTGGGGAPSFSENGQYESYADFNGDGLADRIWKPVGLGGYFVALSTGSSFLAPQQWQVANTGGGGAPSYSDNGQFESYADFNGDGLVDRIWKPVGLGGYFVVLSTGTSFSAPQQWLVANSGGGDPSYSTAGTREGYIDVNGDGLPDRVWIPQGVTQSMWAVLKTAPFPDRVISIQSGYGKQINIEYKPLSDVSVYTKQTGSVYPVVDLQGPYYVVSNYAMTDGIGGFNSYEFNYTGFKFEHTGRGMCGFNQIESIDLSTGIKTVTTYQQDFPFKTLPQEQKVYLSNGTLVERDISTWNQLPSQSGINFPFQDINTEEKYDLQGNLIYSTITDKDYDSFGNVIMTQIIRSDGSSETTINTYINDTYKWFIGLLATSSVTKSVPSMPPATRTSSFTYYSISGLLQSETVELGNTAYEYTKSYFYDQFGNIAQKVTSGSGFQSRAETTQFDSKGQFVISITNALGQSESRQYDLRFGLVTSLTGPNGLTTSWSYDDFGRLVSETHADGTQSTTEYFAADISSPANTAYYIRKQSTGSAPTKTYYDVLDREIRKEGLGYNGQQIFIDKVYDNRGLLAQVSEPYFAGNAILWNTSTYDVLGRVTSTIAPGNIQTFYDYNGLTSSVTNDLGQLKTQTVDVQGRVIAVTDHLGFTLTTKRDSYGNPTQVVDSAGNVTLMSYDLAGRKIAISEPDSGTTTYTYDPLGQMLSQTNALGQTSTYTYDNLGRVLTRTRDEGVESWIYDSAANGVGKLAQVVGLLGYSEEYSYDVHGRLIRTATTIGGKTYNLDQIYDQFGRLGVLVYPSGYKLLHSYNAGGYLSEISSDNHGVIWKADIRNARGQLEQSTLGNGLVTQRSYNTNTGLVQSIQTGSVQNLGFQFDSLGNLISRQDFIAGASETFVYDGMNRLIQSQVSGQAAITVSYDALGNILSRSDIGTYLYGENGAGPHAVTSITGVQSNNFIYDGSGNRVSSKNGKVQYGSTGKPVLITNNRSILQFDLDPSDQRFEERRYDNGMLNERKVYLGGGLYEEIEKGRTVSQVHYIRSSDGPVAVYTNEQSPKETNESIKYLHVDHLGSIQTITDSSGNLLQVDSYDSWGLRRDPSTWGPATASISSQIDRGFTGHEQLDSVGLIHMNGRVYDPAIGRFISADPIVQDSNDMQAYNRYAYVRNNPLSLIDPSGYSWFSKKKLQNFFHKAVKIGAVVGAFVVGTALAQPWTSYAMLAGGFLSSATGAKISGASTGSALLSGLRSLPVSLVLAVSASNIGGAFNNGIVKASAHGVANGLVSQVTGGDFRSGFVSGFASDLGAGSSYLNAMLLGGTANALAGGKFEDGAIRGAFIYMYNHMGHPSESDGKVETKEEEFGSTRKYWQRVEFAETWLGSAMGVEYAARYLEVYAGAVGFVAPLTISKLMDGAANRLKLVFPAFSSGIDAIHLSAQGAAAMYIYPHLTNESQRAFSAAKYFQDEQNRGGGPQ